MGHRAAWCGWDGEGLELCHLVENGALTLEGLVVGPPQARFAVRYRVQTDRSICTREVRFDVLGGPALHLVADGAGQWRDGCDGRLLPALDGCLDIDIAITPATNALPIRRLGFDLGERREILAAYLPPPAPPGAAAGTPHAAAQRYRCLEPGRRFLYEGLGTGARAELEVDAAGLVLDYPGAFRRV